MKNAPERKLSLGEVDVTITRSAGPDNAYVVFIDTSFEPDGSNGPGLRVILNDGDVFVGVPYEPEDDGE